MFEDTEPIIVQDPQTINNNNNQNNNQNDNYENNQTTTNSNYKRVLPLPYEEYSEPAFNVPIFAHNSFIVMNRYLVLINGRNRLGVNSHAFVLDLESRSTSWLQLPIMVSPKARDSFPRASAAMCIVPTYQNTSISSLSSETSTTTTTNITSTKNTTTNTSTNTTPTTSTNAIESSNIMQEYGTTGKIFIFGGWKDTTRYNTFLTVKVVSNNEQEEKGEESNSNYDENEFGSYQFAPDDVFDLMEDDDDDDDEYEDDENMYNDNEENDDDHDHDNNNNNNENLGVEIMDSIDMPPFSLAVDEETDIPGASMVEPRIGSSCVLWENKIFVFGGKTYGDHYFNDLYAYHIESDQRYWEKIEYAQDSLVPPARFHQTAHMNSRGEMFIFFGRPLRSAAAVEFSEEAQSEEWSVVWKFDIYSKRWTKIYGTGDVPSPRSGHCSINITDDYFLILGGAGNIPVEESDSFYLFDSVSETWKAVEPYRRVSYGYRAAVYVPHLKPLENQSYLKSNDNAENNNYSDDNDTPIESNTGINSSSSKQIITTEKEWKDKLYQDQISIFYYGAPSIYGAYTHPLTRLRIPMSLFSSYRSDIVSMFGTVLRKDK